MKKSLLALAVLGAFTGAASAQSSVTLFGVVDVNLTYVNNNVSQYQMSQDGVQSSRLGFRGTEDLGGGLAASFWIEGGINPDTGSTGGQTWTRRSTVSLAGGWGEVRLGRDYTATFLNYGFDPFGTNGIGSAGNLGFILGACGGTAPVNCANLPNGTGYGTALRASNMIGYFIPSGIAGGLYGQVQLAAGEGSPGQKYFGGRLGYASGPFDIAGAYGRTQVTVQGAPAAPPLPAIPGDQNGTAYNFGASWDFKFMKLSGYWGKQEIENGDQDNWFIGAQAPMGVWTFKASYGQMSRTGSIFGINIEGQKASQFAIGAVYDLSRRTALYATYSYLSNDDNNGNGSRLIVAPVANAAFGGGAPGENSSGFQVGVRHAF